MCVGSSIVEQSLFQVEDGGAIPTSTLQLRLKEINKLTASNFYKRWHYLGETDFISTINYGAYYDGWLVGVISYGSPNAKKMRGLYDENTQDGWWEIKRLAMTDDMPKNSESRFIAISTKLLRKSFKVVGMITLADDGVGHTGTIYRASGFEYKGLTAKKSDYVKDGKKVQRGKVSGTGGEWVDRSQKHLFVKQWGGSNEGLR